jgi:hypothetical protein
MVRGQAENAHYRASWLVLAKLDKSVCVNERETLFAWKLRLDGLDGKLHPP